MNDMDIGHWVISETEGGSKYVQLTAENLNEGGYRGILIDQRVLDAAGFSFVDFNVYQKNGLSYDLNTRMVDFPSSLTKFSDVKFLHQLQSMYYVATKELLEVKLKPLSSW